MRVHVSVSVVGPREPTTCQNNPVLATVTILAYSYFSNTIAVLPLAGEFCF